MFFGTTNYLQVAEETNIKYIHDLDKMSHLVIGCEIE